MSRIDLRSVYQAERGSMHLAFEGGAIGFELEIKNPNLIRSGLWRGPQYLAVRIHQTVIALLEGNLPPVYEQREIGVLRIHSSLVRDCRALGLSAETVAVAMEVALQKLLAREAGRLTPLPDEAQADHPLFRTYEEIKASANRHAQAWNDRVAAAALSAETQQRLEAQLGTIFESIAPSPANESTPIDPDSPRGRLLAAIAERVERARESGRVVDTLELGRREFALLDHRPGDKLEVEGVTLAVVVANADETLTVYRAGP